MYIVENSIYVNKPNNQMKLIIYENCIIENLV